MLSSRLLPRTIKATTKAIKPTSITKTPIITTRHITTYTLHDSSNTSPVAQYGYNHTYTSPYHDLCPWAATPPWLALGMFPFSPEIQEISFHTLAGVAKTDDNDESDDEDDEGFTKKRLIASGIVGAAATTLGGKGGKSANVATKGLKEDGATAIATVVEKDDKKKNGKEEMSKGKKKQQLFDEDDEEFQKWYWRGLPVLSVW